DLGMGSDVRIASDGSGFLVAVLNGNIRAYSFAASGAFVAQSTVASSTTNSIALNGLSFSNGAYTLAYQSSPTAVTPIRVGTDSVKVGTGAAIPWPPNLQIGGDLAFDGTNHFLVVSVPTAAYATRLTSPAMTALDSPAIEVSHVANRQHDPA